MLAVGSVDVGLRIRCRNNELVVLGADNYGVDTLRLVGDTIILHGHLALRVGTQIGHHLAFAANGSQLAQQHVRQVDAQRHIVRRLVAGISKHHALVAGSLFLGNFALHAAVYVGALLVQSREHAARVGIKLVFAAVVANTVNHTARDIHQVDVAPRFNFSGNHHLAGGNKCFACHFRRRVVSHELVEDSVADLVGNLVVMPFRNRFGCEKIILHFFHVFAWKKC